MSILDSNGNAVSSLGRSFKSSANRYSRDRAWQPLQLGDIDKLIPQHDRDTLNSVSGVMYANMGVVRGAIDMKGSLAVGNGFNVVFTGENEEWGKEVERFLNNTWFRHCDVRNNGQYDWWNLLRLDSIAMDREGDVGIILTETDTGWPLLQRVRSHRIRSRKIGRVESGEFTGNREKNGIISNRFGKVLAYRVCGDREEDDQIVPESNMLLPFDTSWSDQDRGLPCFSHTLNELRDMLQSQHWEQMAMQVLSSITLIEYNDRGEAEDEGLAALGIGDSRDGEEEKEISTTSLFGGMARHFRSNSGDKLETIKNDRPGDMWDRFQDRLTRSALVPVLPYSLVWKPSGQNTAERSDIEKGQRMIEARQRLLESYALRIIPWAVAKLVQGGWLPAPPVAADWRAFKFTKPPKISINFKNDANALSSLYFAGKLNDADILAGFGKTPEQHYRERAGELALRKKIKEEVEEREGVTIEDREMIMMTPNEVKEQNDDEE